ncbi:MAG TPA: diguanylate cyclase [Armatimonadota bacterium]|nr:diguanylate cyclase [Armatimonadota bacterium]
MKIVVAEDDAASLLTLQSIVRKLGHDCVTASDGAEAWRLIEDAAPEVVISDWMMPGMSGPDLCRRVREMSSDYIYFVLLTGLGDQEHVRMGMQAGADDYLCKPFDHAALEVRLLVAARVTQLHRELSRQRAELERLNQQLYEQARQDPLTGLSNRLRLREDMEQLQARSARYGHNYAVAICDIDNFKLFNDHYGHLAADEALCRVARTLLEHERSGDGVYRFGGEEFLFILPEQNTSSALLAMERMRKAVEELAIPHEALPIPGVVTISAGVAAPQNSLGNDPYLLLKAADSALYLAKRAGRNRVKSCGPDYSETNAVSSKISPRMTRPDVDAKIRSVR